MNRPERALPKPVTAPGVFPDYAVRPTPGPDSRNPFRSDRDGDGCSLVALRVSFHKPHVER